MPGVCLCSGANAPTTRQSFDEGLRSQLYFASAREVLPQRSLATVRAKRPRYFNFAKRVCFWTLHFCSPARTAEQIEIALERSVVLSSCDCVRVCVFFLHNVCVCVCEYMQTLTTTDRRTPACIHRSVNGKRRTCACEHAS